MDDTKNAVSAAVAREVRGLMGKNRCSQKELGQHLNLSQGSISNRLNGDVPWTIDELDQVAAKFDVPITDFFADQGIFRTPCFDNSEAELGELAAA